MNTIRIEPRRVPSVMRQPARDLVTPALRHLVYGLVAIAIVVAVALIRRVVSRGMPD